jgi:hypothetical protein
MDQAVRGVTLSIAIASSVILAVGCGGEQTAATGEPPEVAAVRLFIKGEEVTIHVPLNRGQMERLEVRLYAANGSRITGFDDQFRLTFTFTPTSLGTVTAVPDKPLFKDITPSTSPGLLGSLTVLAEHEQTMTSRTFGPFEVLVH